MATLGLLPLLSHPGVGEQRVPRHLLDLGYLNI